MLETLLAVERPGGSFASAGIDVGEPDVWEGLNVLDLYAGTGALGIEALSRGAAWCDFVESDPRVRQVIGRNLKATGLDRRAATIGTTVAAFVRADVTNALHTPYGVVLIDPPYADPGVPSVMASVSSGLLLLSGALIALEHSRRVDVATHYLAVSGKHEASSLNEVRRRRHGDTEISIYRWEAPGVQEVGEVGHHRDLSG